MADGFCEKGEVWKRIRTELSTSGSMHRPSLAPRLLTCNLVVKFPFKLMRNALYPDSDFLSKFVLLRRHLIHVCNIPFCQFL